jgi:nifR3 family TIM-barrel protein
MVSSEGLVRGIDRTLEYAEYTEEERPVSIQIFGGDPAKMADAARIVEGMGADIVDVNMGCPVPKISKHNAGCSLMREPQHAAAIIEAMVKAVKIPVTVKMRKGWDDNEQTAPDVAKRVQDAGASAITIHGRTAKQSYAGHADWHFVERVAEVLTIPVFGSGDCIEPEQIVQKLRPAFGQASSGASPDPGGLSGVFVGRGVLRNPWILAQAQDLLAGRPVRQVTDEERARFLLDYIELLQHERLREEPGFRHVAPRAAAPSAPGAPSAPSAPRHDRWIINKVRALCSWYTKGIDNGSHLRIQVNAAQSLTELRELIQAFFCGVAPIR